MGVPLHHPFIDGFFFLINHPAIGDPHLCKPHIYPVDPSTFLGSVWGMNWGVFCTFSGDSGGVWIHRVYIYIY